MHVTLGGRGLNCRSTCMQALVNKSATGLNIQDCHSNLAKVSVITLLSPMTGNVRWCQAALKWALLSTGAGAIFLPSTHTRLFSLPQSPEIDNIPTDTTLLSLCQTLN